MIHLVLAALAALPPCWNVYDDALRHSAGAAHPPYVRYSERISIFEDGQRLLQSFANVDYRDDGIARVSDARFDYHPFLTRRAEPGPPEIGPYGARRQFWLPGTDALPVIADVHAAAGVTCTIADEEPYKSHDTYHLVFKYADRGKPRLQELWVDAKSFDVWKLVVTGPVAWSDSGKPDLAQFQVELGYTGPYLLVNHVVWSFRRREYSQYAQYFGEYTFTGYAFPKREPPSYFAQASRIK